MRQLHTDQASEMAEKSADVRSKRGNLRKRAAKVLGDAGFTIEEIVTLFDVSQRQAYRYRNGK